MFLFTVVVIYFLLFSYCVHLFLTDFKSCDGNNLDKMKSFEIKCWGGGWGLPSIDPNCLSVIAYGHLAKATLDVQPTLPKHTITG